MIRVERLTYITCDTAADYARAEEMVAVEVQQNPEWVVDANPVTRTFTGVYTVTA